MTIGEGAVCPATGSFTVDTDLETSGNQDTLTFTDSNWDDAQTVRITATADADTNDNTRLCQVQHSAAGGGYDGVTKPKFLFNQEFQDGSAAPSSRKRSTAWKAARTERTESGCRTPRTPT